jgi:hypothetical protein
VDKYRADQNKRETTHQRHLGRELPAIAGIRKDKPDEKPRDQAADVSLPRNAHPGQEADDEVDPQKYQ